MSAATRRFLPEPQVELVKDEGQLVAIYVRLQNRKAVRTVQPNSQLAVFFYLDDEDIPVGVKFFEPVVGLAAWQVIHTLIAGPDGSPEGVGRQVNHYLLTIEDIEAAIAAMTKAAQAFEPDHEQLSLYR